MADVNTNSIDHTNTARNELRRSLKLTRWTNGIVALLIATLFATAGYLLFFPPSAPDINEQKLMVEVKKRLVEHSDVMIAEATSFAANTAPVLGKALYKEARADFGLYLSAAEKQGDILVEHTEQALRKKLKARWRDYLKTHRDVFKEEFPEITDEQSLDRLIERFEQAGDRLIERYHIDEFRRQSKRTIRLWNDVKPLDAAPDADLEVQLLNSAADWLLLRATDEAVETVLPQPENDGVKNGRKDGKS